MRKGKAILALLLVLALCLALFAACAKDEPAKTEPAKTDTAPAQTDTPAKTDEPTKTDEPAKTEEPDEVEEKETGKSLVFEDGNIVDLKMFFFDLRMTGADYGQRMLDELNSYLEPTYGLHLDASFFNIGDWNTKVQVSIAGGDRCDVMPYLFTQNVTNLYTNNMALPLDDLMAEYAPEACEKMADYMDAFRINGTLYGFPTLKNWVSNNYIIMRKDILEELGMVEKAEKVDSWSAFEEIMQAVKDRYAGEGFYAVGNSTASLLFNATGCVMHGDKFADIERWDSLGDTGEVVYVSDGKVQLFQAQESYEQEAKRLADWYNNGYVWPDTPISNGAHGDEIMKQGVIFATIQNSEIGVETTKGGSIGFELVCPIVYSGTITTGSVKTWGIGIPVTADEPEAAAYFINILYTDAKVMNLLMWGIEGVDYEIEDGQVKHIEDGHYYQADFLIGDNTLLTPLYGNGSDFYDKVKANIAGAPVSPYLGFVLDASNLELAISQLLVVRDQYRDAMMGGLYTPELYQEYVAKLEAAGVEDYLAEIQKQLDAWLAAK